MNKIKHMNAHQITYEIKLMEQITDYNVRDKINEELSKLEFVGERCASCRSDVIWVDIYTVVGNMNILDKIENITELINRILKETS